MDAKTSKWCELLDAICQDSLETSLEDLLANREYHETQEVSRLFLSLYEQLEALREAVTKIICTSVYEERGKPESGISVAMIGAMREAAVLAGVPAYRGFPAGGSSVGEKNLRIGQPYHSRIMDEAISEASNPAIRPPDPKFPNHVEGCICPRFKDIAPDLIADLTCPVHGVNGTTPGDVISERSPARERHDA